METGVYNMVASTHAQAHIRVLLVDDHAVIRTGLKMLLESRPGLAVVGEVGDQESALRVAAREQPDIVLLDLDLDGQDSLQFMPALMSLAPQARVMILTASNDFELQRRAVLLGALGVVQKREAGEVLIKAIENVHAGQVWLDKSMMTGVLAQLSRSDGDKKHGAESGRIGTLTKREREVVTLVGEGLRNKQIAEKLFISETTVRHHITSIFNKLGVSNRLNLVMYAYQHGLAKPPY